MRLTLITMGTSGDVRPFVALGAALAAAGHTPRIATHEAYRDMAVEYGLDFHALPGDVDALLQSASGQSLLGAGGSPLENLRYYSRLADELVDGFIAESTAASQDAELVIGSVAGLLGGGLHAAEKLGTLVAGASLQPLHVTREFASFLFPPWPSRNVPGRGVYNRVTHEALHHITWQLFRRRLDRSRRQQLGLAPLSRRGPASMLARKDGLWLYGYSPALLPRPRDWPSNAEVTGYWFLERRRDWEPPAELADFLAAGPPPVYIGFGSAGRFRAGETVDLALEALHMIGQRGIVGLPDRAQATRVLGDDVMGVSEVPHDWLFPRMSVVVHHVGLGTLETTLRAGRAAVAVPHYMDEPFWARRLAHLGVSPRPISRGKLNAGRLARRIRLALSDQAMHERATRLGGLVSAEDGSRRAVAAIETHAGVS